MTGQPSTSRVSRWLLMATGAAVLVAIVVSGQLVDDDATPPAVIALPMAVAVVYTAMAAVVLRGVPGHPVGRLMAAAGLTAAVAVSASSWSGWSATAVPGKGLLWAPVGLMALALLYFPDGRLPSARWRPVAWLLITTTVVVCVAVGAVAWDHPRDFLASTEVVTTGRSQAFKVVARAGILFSGLLFAAVVGSLWARWRRADGIGRSQLACLLPAGVLALAALVLEAVNVTGAWVFVVLSVPAAMTVAVLRYRLYDLDQVLNRTVVWLVMSLLVLVGFVALVALLRDLFMAGDESNASLVATGLIAVTFEPVRRRVQAGVTRLLYGYRDDPYRVIAQLGEVLGRTVEPAAVLPLLTGTIGSSLRVPYVAVELPGPHGPRRHAEHGTAITTVEAFDMLAHGERVGRLLVATRTPGSRFTARECRLLADVAMQAGVAVEATRLIRDLQASRERLIMAREEERRRLRRDLHDGLGPSLAGMAMQVRAAHKLLTGPTKIAGILHSLAEDLRTCTAEVRQLVDELRPPALDAGLAAALRTECARFDGTAPTVRLELTDDLSGLPAAVEVAVYRIVAEALTNVVRHAAAGSCVVRVARGRSLTVEVVDDGVGIGAARPGGGGTSGPGRRGVGLDSMLARATELGGECVVGPAEPAGTAVRVRLPVPPVDPVAPDGEPAAGERSDMLAAT